MTDNPIMYTILLIDDDQRLAILLKKYFSRYDLQLLSDDHPLEGIERIKQNSQIDLLVLDIMLPDMDGFEVCRSLRKFTDIPILMLTARGDVMDRIIGLEIGADDYLAKPFEPRELVARIHNILKRSQPQKKIQQSVNVIPNTVLQWGDLSINKHNHQAKLKQTELKLTNKEYELLLLLAENPDKNFHRDEIMNALSGIDAELFSRSIDILVSRLRTKLRPLECIQTVWGKGYRFIPPSD